MTRVILVTGGAGYIGSRLIRDLAADPAFADCTIRILDNLQRESYHSLYDLPVAAAPDGGGAGRYQFIEGDILDHAGVRRALADAWAVIHMAAIVRTPLSFGPSGWLEQVNHWGTANLVEAASAAGVERLVYTSSAAVYGPASTPDDAPFRESDPPRPVGLYAETKLRAERHVMAADARGAPQAAILRLGTVFGMAPAARFDAVANRFAYLAATGRPLTVYGAGDQVRPLVHVADASAAIRFALRERLTGIFNVVGEHASIRDLVGAVQAAQPAASVRYTEQDVLTHLSFAIDGGALHARGWYAGVSLEAGLAELLARLRGFAPPTAPLPPGLVHDD